MRVLVTGAGGFIGSRLCQLKLKASYPSRGTIGSTPR